MKKIEKTDWFTAGLSTIETAGFMTLTIEHLCGMLKVTKGSFYHHFGNMDGYIEALMNYWMDENTKLLIAELEQFETAKEKTQALNNLVFLRVHKREQMIRGWSFSNTIVEKYVREVDAIRIDYTAELMQQCGHDAHRARQIAILEYACLVGIQQLFPNMPAEEQEELHDLFSLRANTL